jgi:hypothetical protein
MNEILKFLRFYSHSNLNGKNGLIELLSRDFQLIIPKNYSYSRIIEKITKEGKEKDFCKRLFNSENFEEVLLKSEIASGLNLLYYDELILIADELSNNKKKWSYKKSSKMEMINSIIYNANKQQIDQCLEKLILRKKISPIHQAGEYIIGPLGVTHSQDPKSWLSDDWIIGFLMNNIDYNIYMEFVTNFKLNYLFDKNDPLYQAKSTQTILSYIDNESLIRYLNKLMDDEKIQIKSVEKHWNYIVTPYGIFKKNTEEEEVEALAKLLMNEFSESELGSELSRLGYDKGSCSIRVLELCVKENPNKILDEFFGFPGLKKIARILGIDIIDKFIEKSEAINLILLKLGFEIPPSLIGIKIYQELLEIYKKKLDYTEIQHEEKVGIMTNTYVETERILKDIIYFNIFYLWNNKINNYTPEIEDYRGNYKKSALKEILRDELKIKKDIEVLTFGDLINLLKKMNNYINSDGKIKMNLTDNMKKSEIMPDDKLQILEQISKYRSYFTHDKKINIDIKKCKAIIIKLSNLSYDLEKTNIYPNLIRISKEVENEYGVTYLEAVDEWNRNWILKSNDWIETGPAYFMFSETNPIAINPIIIEKVW